MTGSSERKKGENLKKRKKKKIKLSLVDLGREKKGEVDKYSVDLCIKHQKYRTVGFFEKLFLEANIYNEHIQWI